MREITKYIASDGTEFNTAQECRKYESIIDRVVEIDNLRDNSEVSYCKVAIRQDKEKVKKFKHDFYMLCAEVIPDYKRIFTEVAEGTRHQSHANRILSDYGDIYPILADTVFRIDCISDDGVEYNQPYFAANEAEFKGKIK